MIEERSCAHCGNSFTWSSNGPRQLYCSRECRSIASKLRHNPDWKPRFFNIPIDQGYFKPSVLPADKVRSKGEVCRDIYLRSSDPDSIMDLVEDITGIRCPKKDEEDP